jgi:hypothetical protein
VGELRFSWDPRKAKVNLAKHGVSFDEAATVFLDEEALLRDDPDHSFEEEPFLLLGLSSGLRLLLVCHAIYEEEDLIRLISARKATRREQAQYNRRFSS